jgi:hypothetical protein
MTNSNQISFDFPKLKTVNATRKVEVEFSGAEVSSDGGAFLLQSVDNKLGLTKSIAKILPDNRNPLFVDHDSLQMLRQRVYAIALGYEDLNDWQSLRHDTVLQTAMGKDTTLASPPTLCRFEKNFTKQATWETHKILIDLFIKSHSTPPTELTLDFDATDDIVHGKQEGRHFHGYYDNYCFLPLYVFCGDQLLVSYLRPSNIDGAKHSWAIAALLVKRLREEWPGVKITFRGDGGFCRHKMLTWFEKHNVFYVVGIATNKRLQVFSKDLVQQAENDYKKTELKQKIFSEFMYAADTWSTQRRIIVKAEHSNLGENTRYIVTNLSSPAQQTYESTYCGRGEMENRIKEQQMDLFADKTSCHQWWSNQFRLILSSLAYTLHEALRRQVLHGTELAQATAGTIRLKLLKIGAVIIRNTRRVKVMLSSHYPYQKLFTEVVNRLTSTA